MTQQSEQTGVVTDTRAMPSEGAVGVVDALRTLLSVAFVLALPLLIISTSVRGLFSDRDFMLQGFRENGVSQTTGLDDRQLEQVADAFASYFNAPPGPMDVGVRVGGMERPLFNPKEIAHMEDVQALVQFFFKLQIVTAGIVLVRGAVALAVDRSVRPLGLEMVFGAATMVVLVALVGALATIDFTTFWTRFHQIAFRNGLWMLDPSTDYLIMLFPEPFWYAGTMRLALWTTAMTVAAGIGGFLAWRVGR